jgi:hypothetical protein
MYILQTDMLYAKSTFCIEGSLFPELKDYMCIFQIAVHINLLPKCNFIPFLKSKIFKLQGEEFISTQRYYSSFYHLLSHLSATCFGRTTIFKQKKCISEITLLTMDPLFLDIN